MPEVSADTDRLNKAAEDLEEAAANRERDDEKKPDGADPFAGASDDADAESKKNLRRVQDTADTLRGAADSMREQDTSSATEIQSVDPTPATSPSVTAGFLSQANNGGGAASAQQQAVQIQQMMEAQRQQAQQQWFAQQQQQQAQQQWFAQQQQQRAQQQQQWAAQQQWLAQQQQAQQQQQQWLAQQQQAQAMQNATPATVSQPQQATVPTGGTTSSDGALKLSNDDLAEILRATDGGGDGDMDSGDDSTRLSSDTGTSDGDSDMGDDDPNAPTGHYLNPDASDADRESNARAETTVIIGDSTTVQIEDALAQRLDEDGVPYTIDSKGGRAIIEGGDGSGLSAIQAQKAALGGGSENTNWFIGLGVNDANNIAANSGVSQADRIAQVMDELSDQGTVYWPMVDISPDASTGYDLGPEVDEFNNALLDAEKEYPNLRVVSWNPSDDKYRDGIHYNEAGMDERVDMIADVIQ